MFTQNLTIVVMVIIVQYRIRIILCLTLLATPALAAQCPVSHAGDSCAMAWSVKYHSCVIANEAACTHDDLTDRPGSEYWKAKDTEWSRAMEAAKTYMYAPQITMAGDCLSQHGATYCEKVMKQAQQEGRF